MDIFLGAKLLKWEHFHLGHGTDCHSAFASFCMGMELALFILFLCERRMSFFLLSFATRPDSAENDGTERHHQLCHHCILSTWVSFSFYFHFFILFGTTGR